MQVASGSQWNAPGEYGLAPPRPGEHPTLPHVALPQGMRLTDSILAPLVTIIIPTRNRPFELAFALQSVNVQTYQNFEVIVVNDHSDEEHLPSYSDLLATAYERFGRHRLHYVHLEEHKGQAFCLNLGLKMAQGDYISYLNDDDGLFPLFIENQLEYLLLNKGIDFVYGDYVWTKDSLSYSLASPRPEPYSFERLKQVQMCHAISLFRAEAAKWAGWDENLKHQEDWDFLLRVGSKYKGCYLRDIVTWWLRKHGTQKSESDNEAMEKATTTVAERIASGYYDRHEFRTVKM